MRNNFVYSYSIKIHALRFDKLVESIFYLLLVVEVFSLEKVKMLEEVAFGWWEVGWIWWMKHNFVQPTSSTLEVLAVWCTAGRCPGELGPFCRPMLTVSIEADHQTVTRTFFLCCQFSFGKDFGASFWSNHWAGRCRLSYKIHFSSHVTIWSRNGSLLLQRIRDDTSKWYFLICGQLMRHSLIELSHLANLLQIPNDHRTVDTEFFRNFLFSCEMRSFDHCS